MATRIETISDVVERQLCTGCGACAYVSKGGFEMVDIGDLGRRPVTDGPVQNESDCLRACPGIALSHPPGLEDEEGLDSTLLRDWGPVRKVWEVHAADADVRYTASSGGAATAIAQYCLEILQFEGVLHTGIDSDKPYLNKTVFSKTVEELRSTVGSRYAPSSPCDGLGSVESAEGKCVFIGKPCDVAGAKLAADENDVLESKLDLTIAFVCAGTPSTYGTEQLLRNCGVEDLGSVQSLRYRGHGWPGRWTVEFQGDNGEVLSHDLSYEESWGFLQRYRQWRCYICPDHTGEFADITVGDPWWRTPAQDDVGRSLIAARTKKGEAIIQDAIARGYLSVTETGSKILPLSQPNILRTRSVIWGRLLALKLTGSAVPEYSGFHLFTLWKEQLSPMEMLRSVLGTFKRVWRKRLFRRIKVQSGDAH